jgi:hypothetical protein
MPSNCSNLSLFVPIFFNKIVGVPKENNAFLSILNSIFSAKFLLSFKSAKASISVELILILTKVFSFKTVFFCSQTVASLLNLILFLCISVFYHTAVMLAMMSLSKSLSPKYLRFNL